MNLLGVIFLFCCKILRKWEFGAKLSMVSSSQTTKCPCTLGLSPETPCCTYISVRNVVNPPGITHNQWVLCCLSFLVLELLCEPIALHFINIDLSIYVYSTETRWILSKTVCPWTIHHDPNADQPFRKRNIIPLILH